MLENESIPSYGEAIWEDAHPILVFLLGVLVYSLIPFFVKCFSGALQIPDSLGDKFSDWDSQNETLTTHYEYKNQKPR